MTIVTDDVFNAFDDAFTHSTKTFDGRKRDGLEAAASLIAERVIEGCAAVIHEQRTWRMTRGALSNTLRIEVPKRLFGDKNEGLEVWARTGNATQIKDSWRLAFKKARKESFYADVEVRSEDELADHILAAIAPTIVKGVVDECAKLVEVPIKEFRNIGEFGIAGALEDVADEIRNDVPKEFGC